jgi:hypothetical protein
VILLVVNVALALALGTRLARLGSPEDGGATGLVRAGLWTCAVIVAVEELLGVARLLGPMQTAAALALANAATFAATRRRWGRRAPRPRAPWTALELGLAAALVAALVTRLWHGLSRETFLYDTLSYHLHAPVTWMHDGRLSIVDAVFGDPAPAYAPSNVELVFLFLMAPVRSDYLASAGQMPFAVLAALAVVAAVRQSGGARAAALAGALAFSFVPEVWQQAPTAMVDVGTAAFLLAALPFLVGLGRGVTTADAAALGLAVGLAAGSKVVGLVYAAPLIAAAIVTLARSGQLRSRAGCVALGAALLAGGFWYARNLLVARNPLYPATVKLGPATIFQGLYDGAVLRTSDYHLPVGDLRALGSLLIEPGLGFALVGALALLRARRPLWGVLACAFLLTFWLVLPHQESRFLFPLWGVVAVALAAPTRQGPPALAWAPLVMALAGSLIQFPTPERWAVAALGLTIGLAAAPIASRLTDRRVVRAGAALAAVATACALGVGLRRYEGRDPAYSVGDELDAPWAWVRANVRGRRVAYTGNNLPFPLAGAGLANDVRYVNVAGAPGDLAHDCARRSPVPATPEPAPCREGARYETWRANLRAAGRDVLFVAALYPGVQRTISADADGFPVERSWADAHPDSFTLRFANSAARIYSVTP